MILTDFIQQGETLLVLHRKPFKLTPEFFFKPPASSQTENSGPDVANMGVYEQTISLASEVALGNKHYLLP